jgi:hypothetical protein
MRNELRDQAEEVIDVVGRDGALLVHSAADLPGLGWTGGASAQRPPARCKAVVVALDRTGAGWARRMARLSEIAPTAAIWVPKRRFLGPSVEALRCAFLGRGYRIDPRTVLFPRTESGTWIGFERMSGDALVAHAELAAADVLRRPLPEALSMLQSVLIMAGEIPQAGRATVFGSGSGCSTWALASLTKATKVVGLEQSYDLLDYALWSYSNGTTTFEPVGRRRRDGGEDDAFLVVDPLPASGDYADVGYRAERSLGPGGRLVVCIPEEIVDCDTGRTAAMSVDLLCRLVGPAFRLTRQVATGPGRICATFERALPARGFAAI